ncbi:MAG: T9SS type A sorting domain-containing protein [Candidatus Coatesbacteria bacterium]|nr:T9SS type A sorting domain-containing protein [Candidatus Coatesbacteria bacterium]
MIKRIASSGLIVALLTVSIAAAESEIQTDWSGGDGVLLPTSSWDDRFSVGSDVDWYSIPGQFSLTLARTGVAADLEGAYHVSVVDIDDDDDPDILASCNVGFDGRISWWENLDGSGSSWSEHLIEGYEIDVSQQHVADIDNDGDPDALASIWDDDSIVWWSNDDGVGGAWTKHVVDQSMAYARGVYAADINDDGDMDILGTAFAGSVVAWYENADGQGTGWTKHVVDGYCYHAAVVTAADLDADGDLDIIGSGRYSNDEDDFAWWENLDGAGTSWTIHQICDNYEADSIMLADIDNDLVDDLVCSFLGSVSWWSNDNGDGSLWTKHAIDDDVDDPRTVFPVDIDDDGDLDVVATVSDDAAIVWWSNDDGVGGAWTKHHVIGAYEFPTDACAADLDDDGALEILGCAYNANRIDWWEVEELAPVGVLHSSILDTRASEVDWGELIWDADVPDGAVLTVEVRAGDDFANLGDWMTVAASHDKIPAVLDDSRYFQYRLILEPSSTNESPLFDEIELFFESDAGLSGASLTAQAEDDGVLVGWTCSGETPAGVRVLRGADDPAAVSGSLPGGTTRWLDRGVEPGGSYVYWLETTEENGSVRRFGPSGSVVLPETTQRLILDIPYPSPASEALTLSYTLPEGCASALLTIYDISGRRIFTQTLEPTPGRHPLVLDVAGYPQGIYIARIAGDNASASRRFVISR